MATKKTSPAASSKRAVASTRETAAETDAVSHFEQDLQELEQIVEQMESGDLPLEKSLQLFERGVVLGKQCRNSLQKVEQRIRELTPDEEDAIPPTEIPDAENDDFDAPTAPDDSFPF